MPTLTVIAGNTYTKPADWDEIMSVKEELKQFFRWDPKSKAWVLRPLKKDDIEAAAVLLAKVFDEDTSHVMKVLAKAVEEETTSKKKKVLQQLEALLDENIFATIPLRRLSEDQWKLAMRVFKWENKKLVLRIDRVANWVVENNISEVRFVPELLRFMDSLGLIYGDRHVEYLHEIKKLVFEEAEKYRMLKDSILLEDSGEDIIVRFGRRLDPVERKILYDELSTVYFTTDKNGDLIEHRMRVIHYDKTLGVYRIPYFAVDHLYEACRKLGFEAVIDKVGWVKKDIPKPDFRLKLYPFQEEAVRAWLNNNCKGVVVVPTGGGKTIIALAALQLIHVPTLICVPTIELARQWRNTIRKVLGVEAGILGGGSKDIRPITVAIYNSAVNEITKLKDKFDFVIFDECFTYDTLVLTDRGWMKIGDIVENRLPVRVLTHTGQWRRVVAWHKKPAVKRMVKVMLSNGAEVVCTEDHKILTTDGWKEAGKLTNLDEVIWYGCEKEAYLPDMWEGSGGDKEASCKCAQNKVEADTMLHLPEGVSEYFCVGRAYGNGTLLSREEQGSSKETSEANRPRTVEEGAQEKHGAQRAMEDGNSINIYAKEVGARDTIGGRELTISKQKEQECTTVHTPCYIPVRVRYVEVQSLEKSNKYGARDSNKQRVWGQNSNVPYPVLALSNGAVQDNLSEQQENSHYEMAGAYRSPHVCGCLVHGRWNIYPRDSAFQFGEDGSRRSKFAERLVRKQMVSQIQDIRYEKRACSEHSETVGNKEIHEFSEPIYSQVYDVQDYVYDLTVEVDHTYIANGFVVHNCHHVPAETFRKVAFNIKARKRLGLSATPQRTDRNEALIFFSVGKMVYKAVYAELVRLKLASPLVFKTIMVPLTDKEYNEYLKASDEEGNRVQKRMKIALMASKKYLVLENILKEHSNAKTLVFTQYVDQAKQAYKVAKKVLGKDKVALIMGNTPAKERDSAFEKFKNGKVTCLVSTTVLDEGVDVPDAEVAIILSGSSTERQLIQRIGRVIRYYPGKVAKVYEVVAQGTIEEKHATRRRAVLRDYRIEVEA